MAIKSSRFYHDPAMAQAAANLADLFAPPSGSDASGYASARATDLETNQRQAMWDYMQRPGADQTLLDRAGIISDLYDPSQSYYAVDTGAATQRYGYDTQAATSRSNNEADNIRAAADTAANNKRALLQTLYGNLGRGDVRPAVDPEIAEQYDIPALPRQEGLPVPLSETEVKGGLLSDLASGDTGDMADIDVVKQALLGTEMVPTLDENGNPVNVSRFNAPGTTPVLTSEQEQGRIIGGLSEEQQLQKVLGTDVVQVVDPDTGDLTYANRYDAAGKTPVPGTAPATDTFQRKDGSTFVGYADAQGQIHNQATQELEPTAVRKGAPAADAGKNLQVDDFIAIGPDNKEKRFVGYIGDDKKIHDFNTDEVVPNVIQKGIGSAGLSITTNPDGTVTVTQGGPGGARPTDKQTAAGFAGEMMEAPTKIIVDAFNSGNLPAESDYQVWNLINHAQESGGVAGGAIVPTLSGQMSDQGRLFYNALQQALPYPLMVQSGQAVVESEYRRKLLAMMPLSTDDKATLASKRTAFETAQVAINRLAGAAKKPDAAATQAAEPATPPAASAAPAATTPGPNDTILEFDAQGNLKK